MQAKQRASEVEVFFPVSAQRALLKKSPSLSDIRESTASNNKLAQPAAVPDAVRNGDDHTAEPDLDERDWTQQAADEITVVKD